jgi:hypothetical protein
MPGGALPACGRSRVLEQGNPPLGCTLLVACASKLLLQQCTHRRLCIPVTVLNAIPVLSCRLLLLRGRLAQSCIELPEGLFDPGQAGDEELMRFALCYNLLQVRMFLF